jgi:hypothetical protein
MMLIFILLGRMATPVESETATNDLDTRWLKKS